MMKRTQADKIYAQLLSKVLSEGDSITTRNSDVFTHFNLPNVTFTEFPLVTVRKTAAMKAIREMEWFLSGNVECPGKLHDWWTGQLNIDNLLLDGYSQQFREFVQWDRVTGDLCTFDQVDFIINALKSNPNSRRLIMTVWNPGEMAAITETNDNPNTPTCCHSIVVQFFVRNGELHMKTYQRSADMLLGVPHNWVQSWAMLMYFANSAGLKVGSMTWMWGDAHIYNEESHLEVANLIIDKKSEFIMWSSSDLEYTPTSADFIASDFKITGEVFEPLTTIRPKLL